MRISAIMLLGAVLVTGGACQTSGSGAGVAGAWQGEQSGTEERLETVARTDAEWAALWQRAGQSPPSALPSGQMAVAIFLGKRITPGYGVTIESIAMRPEPSQGEALVITYRERVPPPTTATAAQSEVSPYTICLTGRSDKPIRFVRAKNA